MIKLEKKQVKIFSIVIALIFIGSVVAIALTQTGNIASAASSSSVGIIDYQQVMAAHPDVQGLQTQMETAIADIKKEFDEKSAGTTRIALTFRSSISRTASAREVTYRGEK